MGVVSSKGVWSAYLSPNVSPFSRLEALKISRRRCWREEEEDGGRGRERLKGEKDRSKEHRVGGRREGGRTE